MTAATAWVDDHFIAGDPALDFANAVYRRTPEFGVDLFNNTESLTAWLDRVHLLPVGGLPGSPSADTGAVLDEARS